MTTRSQASALEAYAAQVQARTAAYANNPGTGFAPPEACYAPVRPGARSRLTYAEPRQQAREDLYADSATTGFAPPEVCRAPMRPGARSRIYA